MFELEIDVPFKYDEEWEKHSTKNSNSLLEKDGFEMSALMDTNWQNRTADLNTRRRKKQ